MRFMRIFNLFLKLLQIPKNWSSLKICNKFLLVYLIKPLNLSVCYLTPINWHRSVVCVHNIVYLCIHFLFRFSVIFWLLRQFVRLGEYDTESQPVDCIMYEDDKDCNDPPFDSTVASRCLRYLTQCFLFIFLFVVIHQVFWYIPSEWIRPRNMILQ